MFVNRAGNTSPTNQVSSTQEACQKSSSKVGSNLNGVGNSHAELKKQFGHRRQNAIYIEPYKKNEAKGLSRISE